MQATNWGTVNDSVLLVAIPRAVSSSITWYPSRSGNLHHDIGRDRGDIERLLQHALGIKAVAGVDLTRQIAISVVRLLPRGEELFRSQLDNLFIGQPENLLNTFIGVVPDELLDKISPETGIVLDGTQAQGRVGG